MSGGIRVDASTVAVVTDLGRSRGPSVGLPVNGALDQYSARVANILVANAEGAPLIEVTAFDFSFTAEIELLIAVTGAPMLRAKVVLSITVTHHHRSASMACKDADQTLYRGRNSSSAALT